MEKRRREARPVGTASSFRRGEGMLHFGVAQFLRAGVFRPKGETPIKK